MNESLECSLAEQKERERGWKNVIALLTTYSALAAAAAASASACASACVVKRQFLLSIIKAENGGGTDERTSERTRTDGLSRLASRPYCTRSLSQWNKDLWESRRASASAEFTQLFRRNLPLSVTTLHIPGV